MLKEKVMGAEEIGSKIEEYSEFVSKKLRPELERAEKSRDAIRAEMKEYSDLVKQLENFRKEKKNYLQTMADLGEETIFCSAIGKLDMIYVNVGMGFHIEMTVPEAIHFVQLRLTFLKNDVLKGKELRVQDITEHVMAASLILDELNQELQQSG